MAEADVEKEKKVLLEEHRVKAVPSVFYLPDFVSAEQEDELIKNVYGMPKPTWTVLKNRRLINVGGYPEAKGMIGQKLPPWLNSLAMLPPLNGLYGGKSANHVLVNEYLSGQGIMPHGDGPIFFPTIATITVGSHTVIDFYSSERFDDQGNPCCSSPSCPSVAFNVDLLPTSKVTKSAASQKLISELESLHRRKHLFSLFLERRSLVIIRDDAYQLLHGIEERKSDLIDDYIANLAESSLTHLVGQSRDRETRISLTIRNVPKVITLPKFMK